MIEVIAGDLKKALALATAVVQRRNTIPVLANVLLSVSKEQGLSIIATDLDMEVRQIVAGAGKPKDIKPFETTVSAHLLAAMAGAVDKDSGLKLSPGDGKLIVTGNAIGSNGLSWTVPTLPAEDFPIMPPWRAESGFDLPVFDLEAMLSAVSFAISGEETRYYLNGVFLHPAPNVQGITQLTAATTDGHRLARFRCDLPDGADTLPGIIIPRRALPALLALVAGQGVVSVEAAGNRVSFQIGDTVLTTKTIDGEFPDYTRVIPTANNRLLTFEPDALRSAIKRVQIVSSEKSRAVRLALSASRAGVSMISPENGRAEDEIQVEYAQDDMTIGCNAKYLLDILSHLSGPSKALLGDDPAAPIHFYTSDGARADFVLMPVRV